MKKFKWKNILVFIALIIFIVLLIVSVIDIIKWDKDNKKTSDQIDKIEKIVEVVEKEDDDKTEIITPIIEVPEVNPYWDYVKMNLIYVDFSELKLINNQVKGWIQVNGTNINYPFVQAEDNKYYLNHSFDKSYNEAGWVFMDYRNSIDELSKNTIIYAHGRIDTTMFGSLKNIIKNNWYKNTDNYVVKLSTEKENTLWQVFSVYIIPTTSDYIQVDFASDEEFKNLTDKLIERSEYDFNTLVDGKDKILTLSTCYNEEEKVVMHAKLIKVQKR